MLATLRQRNFALLWSGGLISLTGDWMLLIALPIYVYEATGSTLATGAMFAARLLPDALLGSVAGVFVDRWDRRRTMVFVNLLMALSMLVLLAVPYTGALWIVYVAAFAEVSAGAFLRPAENALLPSLVGEGNLIAANSLNALNNNLARLIGPALGGVAAGTLGLGGVAILNAASFLIAGAMIWLITGRYRPARGQATNVSTTAVAAFVTVWREWLEGLRLVRTGRLILTIFIFATITGLGEGVIVTVLPAFVKEALGGGALELGWLMSAQAVGGLIGGLAVGYVARVMPPPHLLGWSAVAFGIIGLAAFNYPAFFPGIAVVLAFFVAAGVPAIGMMASMNTLLQSAVIDRYRGRIFGALNTTQALMMLTGTILAGFLGDILGAVLVLNVQGGARVLAGVLVLVLLAGPAATITARRDPTAPKRQEAEG